MTHFEHREIDVLELDVDSCLLRYGAGACTAGTDIHTGTSQAGATDTTIRLAAGASAVDDFYNGDAIALADGRLAVIADYNGTTKDATIDRKWPVNLFTRSRQFGHADWSKTGLNTVEADALAGPDGIVDADLVTEDSSTGLHQLTQSVSFTTGTAYALAAKVKPAGRDLVLTLPAAAFPAAAEGVFDLTEGTAVAGAGADFARIRKLCDGYWLCIVVATANATAAGAAALGLYNGAVSYAGGGSAGLYLAAAHCRKADQADDFIETDAAAIGLPDAVAYRVISAGAECYNTFETCQDKPNYRRGRQCWQLCTVGAPVPAELQIRPYITRTAPASTDLAVEKGLATRGKVTITLADEPSSDIEADPYHATRPSPAQGNFFARLFARSPNIVGRLARFRRAHFAGAWRDADFTGELYIVENTAGPDGTGRVELTLKDPIKLADRAKVPAPSGGLLDQDLAAADLRLVLRPGDGLEYPHWTGLVRVGEELIAYSNREASPGFNFNNQDLEGFGGNEVSASWPAAPDSDFYINVVGAGANPYLLSPATLSFLGQKNRYVAVRIRRNSGTSWAGEIAYATPNHGISASYYKSIPDPTITGEWVVAVWDMFALTAGGDDWKNSQITQLFFAPHADGTTDSFDIDWIAWADPAPVSSDVLVMADSSERGQWGTVAAEADAGAGVQLCKVYQNMPAWQVMEDLLLASDIPAANINSIELAAEDANWLGPSYLITAVLSEPESGSKLIAELALALGGFVWWDAITQQTRFQVLAPLSIGETVAATLTAEGDVVARSVRVRVRDELRRTEMQVWYDRISQTADLGELVNYRRQRVRIDADAESDNLYGDIRPDVVKSRFLTAQNDAAVATLAYRRIAFFRNAPKNIDLRLDMKDRELWVGDVVDLEIDELVDETGAPLLTRCLVIRRRDDVGRIDLTLLPMAFGIRVAFLAPNGTGAYPAGAEYLHICPDSGFFADGTPGYQPF